MTGNAFQPEIGIHATRPSTFVELCEYLGSTGGGYTLWIGAGASIAATGGSSPSWATLADELAIEAEGTGKGVRPARWDALDLPDKLEWISGKLSHGKFRSRLRDLLVKPVVDQPLDIEVCLDHATIGARASTVVSFNIELMTSLYFAAGAGGAFISRTYLPPGEYVAANMNASAGGVGRTVYFPHGLLDTQGNCVMTRSEYDRLGASLAASTAVNLCLGGDLLILGMSLGDSYLRDAILKGRQWIRNVYWVNEEFPFVEWARVAKVTCIEAEHSAVWTGIASAAISADTDGALAKSREVLRTLMPARIVEFARQVRGMQTYMTAVGARVCEIAAADAGYLERFADHCIDLGLDVPDVILNDSRWRRPKA